jgi:hypothetical protein
MKSEQIELFVHGSGAPQVVAAALNETLKDVLARLSALPGHGEFVFIGESIEVLENPDLEADSHQAVDIELTIEVLQLHKHKHIHTKALHRIEVKVHFNGTRERKFSPATTIATVTAWAKKKLGIDPAAGAEYVLQLSRGESQPRPEVHLGELLSEGEHTLEFALVREVTPLG